MLMSSLSLSKENLLSSIESSKRMILNLKIILATNNAELELLKKEEPNKVVSGMLFWKKTAAERINELKNNIEFAEHRIQMITNHLKKREKEIKTLK